MTPRSRHEQYSISNRQIQSSIPLSKISKNKLTMTELSASTIILEYVCPGLGVVICQFMFSAPYRDLKQAIDRGHIGDLNPTPWAFMLGNCFGWVVYSVLTQNLFIFWANAPGFVLSVYLNLGAVKLLYQRHHSTEIRKSFVAFLQQEDSMQRFSQISQQWTSEVTEDSPAGTSTMNNWATLVWNITSQTTPAPAPHETLVLAIVVLWTSCMSLLAFAQSFDSTTRELIVGSLVNLNLVFFYGAPLSTIYNVLAQRNSSTIHLRTMATNTLNGIFWTAYGIAVLDPFVYAPNGLGALLGVIQVVLIILFPRKPSEVVQADHESTLPLAQKQGGSILLSPGEEEEAMDASSPADVETPKAASTDGSSLESETPTAKVKP